MSSIPILDMLAHNWSLGLTSFGGPTVHFQIFHQLFVSEYQWLDETTYQEMFALCQALCGPGSTKMLFGVNVLRYGFWTGLMAFVVWSLPTAIAAFGLAIGISNVGDELPGPVYALLSGLNAATVGIVALAAVQLSKKAITDRLTRILVFFGGTAGMLYNALWYFLVLMVAGATCTVICDLRLIQSVCKRLIPRQHDAEATDGDIELRSIDPVVGPSAASQRRGKAEASTPISATQPALSDLAPEAQPWERSRVTRSWKMDASIIAGFFTSFVVIMVCRGLFSGASRAFDLFANLYLAGTIIFGGGPVVIPLLREYTVAPGWVSPRDFLLGLAITQAFPGPNFNFAVYLGTLAFHGTGGSVHPVAGATLGYVAIFAPGLWLHTGFIGIWSKVRKLQTVKTGLRGLHATAVGLVFTAVYRLFEIGYLDEIVQSGGSLSRDPWWVSIGTTLTV